MKNHLLIIALILIAVGARAQESMVTLSYGYAFANPEDSNENADGFRINGLFEYNPSQGKIAHGLNIGYVLTTYSQENQVGAGSSDFSIRSWPVYYAPKVILGNSDKFKFYLNGALGLHFSKYTSDGALNLETTDTGFYGGAGLGGMLFLKENIFLNLEYEWAYLSNSFYNDGFLNTAQLGIGFKF
jgi:Outer membrane protein beta-barrel domain